MATAKKTVKKENKEVKATREVVEVKAEPKFIRLITPCITPFGSFKAGEVVVSSKEMEEHFKIFSIAFESLN